MADGWNWTADELRSSIVRCEQEYKRAEESGASPARLDGMAGAIDTLYSLLKKAENEEIQTTEVNRFGSHNCFCR